MHFISQLKEKFFTHKTLVKNFSYLSFLQGFNMLLPLVTYPFLIRVLGTETYGLVVFSQAVIGYLVILVSFGFNIIGTKEVSLNRGNLDKLSEIVSSIFLVKGSLLILSILLLSIFLNYIPEAENYQLLFYFTLWMCFYEVIFPGYYFQGLEKMKYVTYITLATRITFLSLIFLFIHSEDDYLKVPIINGVGAIIAGFISIRQLKKDGIKIRLESFSTLFFYIKKSYVMALAYVSNAFKSNFNLIAVKFLFSFTEVAYFDLAQKIVNIGITFLDLISQTVFPKMSREKKVSFFKKVLKLSLFASFTFVFFILLFSESIVEILGGQNLYPANKILRILVFLLPIYITGALLGRNCLIVHGYDKQVFLSMVTSSLLYILLLAIPYILGIKISLTILALFYLSSFLFETTYRYFICHYKKLL